LDYLSFHYSKTSLKENWLVGWFMVFNATFNNISVISWWSVLLVEQITKTAASHWQT
jgi:hypothetical protein